jgi:hypothetical protein
MIPPKSLAHTHVGSSPIVGPFFGQTSGFLLFSVSDRIYGVPFSLSAPRVASDVPQGPESPSHRYRYPPCLPRKYHLHTILSEHFFISPSPILYAVIRTARVCSKAWRPSSAYLAPRPIAQYPFTTPIACVTSGLIVW